MKKFLLAALAVVLALCMLSGCSNPQTEPATDTEDPIILADPDTPPAADTTPADPATPPAADTTPTDTQGDAENEDNASADAIDAAYAQQIEQYYTALSEQWNEGAYFEHELSPMAVYYYEGNALDNVGFTFMDLNGDAVQELIIGAIRNAQQDPLVFEIWTLNNGEPVMLAQSGSRNRYYLQYAQEDELWSIAYEAENGAANHAVYYLQLSDGQLEVIQGVIFDAVANESAPWFMAYDLDWDVSNDTPIDEDTATAVMEAGRNIYTAVEYLPYSLYN